MRAKFSMSKLNTYLIDSVNIANWNDDEAKVYQNDTDS